MSNLNNKFDILRGWPSGAAVDETFTVNTGVTVVEGLLVSLNSSDNLILPTAVLAQGAAAGPSKFRMVISGNDQFDGVFTGKAVALRGTFTVQTDQFVAASYTPGQLLTVHVAVDADQGKLCARTVSNEQVVGEVESYDATNGILVVSMAI